MGKRKLLCIDDDRDFLIALRLQLREQFRLFVSEGIEEGLKIAEVENPDLILLDVKLESGSGIDAIPKIKSMMPDPDIVMISGARDPKLIVQAIRAGAIDYLTKPFDLNDLLAIFEKQRESKKIKERYQALVQSQNEEIAGQEIIYKSSSMRRLFEQAARLKNHEANVLIVGETGTGKELLARFIHDQEGKGLQRPFVAVNCAAIPEQLLEAELFGAEVGAYTSLQKRRIGKFELADGGDIFLDEIGSLRLDLQAKILRVLQEKEFSRLGSNETIKANFRVIAAANVSLDEKLGRGEFRMDLYHRIRVIQLNIPPLRDRKEDIAELVEYAMNKFSRDGVRKKITPLAMVKLVEYQWPGNVRELINVVHSLIILSRGDLIDESSFPSWVMNGTVPDSNGKTHGDRPVDCSTVTLKEYLAQAEKIYIQTALESCRGDKSKTARMLNMGRTTLYARLKDLGMM
ncbi:MAG TPA: sigma-54 dependent transcriptional regulator [bacterium]|nr:sigma-54 dependent transcriptional regulator [bacterium]